MRTNILILISVCMLLSLNSCKNLISSNDKEGTAVAGRERPQATNDALTSADTFTKTSNSIAGQWTEVRGEGEDDYLKGQYVFREDHTGRFSVYSFSGRNDCNITWEQDGNYITVYMEGVPGEPTILELNNGILYEQSDLMGTTSYKRQ